MKYDFFNRVGFVSGDTKGIGKAIAMSLLYNGVKVIVNYNNDVDAARSFSKELNEINYQTILLKSWILPIKILLKILAILLKKNGTLKSGY